MNSALRGQGERGNKGVVARLGVLEELGGPLALQGPGLSMRSPRCPAGGVPVVVFARAWGDDSVWQEHLLRQEALGPAERRASAAAFFRPGQVMSESRGRPAVSASGRGQPDWMRTKSREDCGAGSGEWSRSGHSGVKKSGSREGGVWSFLGRCSVRTEKACVE